jgi:hypothetical protein
MSEDRMEESTVIEPSENGRLRTGRVGLSLDVGEGWKPSILMAPDMAGPTGADRRGGSGEVMLTPSEAGDAGRMEFLLSMGSVHTHGW